MSEVKILYAEEARKGLLSGIEKIAKAVKGTLGPSGKNVLIRNSSDSKPFATKDGVTVAAQVKSNIYIEQLAIESMQEAANNADNRAGDGTTTATILAEGIFSLGVKYITDSHNIIDIKKGIDIAVSHVVSRIKAMSKSCDNDFEVLRKVALISSNNDDVISKVVVDAFKVSGNQGVVNLKRSKTAETHLVTMKGMNISTGYRSPYYVNDHANDIVDFENPYLYVTNEKITSITENLNSLLMTVSQKQIPLVIICKDIDPVVSGILIEENTKGRLKVCVCKAPGFGEAQNQELVDIGTVLGKEPFLDKSGLEFNKLNFNIELTEEGEIVESDVLSYLMQSERIIVRKDNLLINAPAGKNKKELEIIEKAKTTRADALRKELEECNTQYEKSVLQMRISRLTNGIAFINIGALNDMEFLDKQARVQDTLYAVKSSSDEGIIPGGGTTLLYISNNDMDIDNDKIENDSVALGIEIVTQAIRSPFIQILENVGIDFKNKYDSFDFNQGIDARKKEETKDMITAGIIDPAKVTRVALENAASIAGMLLTTDCVIIDESVYENNQTSIS